MFFFGSSVPPPPEMQYTGSVSLDNGKYNASWLYKDDSDAVYFRVDVVARGWVAFALANQAPTNMVGYDAAVGGVDTNGTGYLKVICHTYTVYILNCCVNVLSIKYNILASTMYMYGDKRDTVCLSIDTIDTHGHAVYRYLIDTINMHEHR